MLKHRANQVNVDEMSKLQDAIKDILNELRIEPLDQNLEIHIKQFLQNVRIVPDNFLVWNDRFTLSELLLNLLLYLHSYFYLLHFFLTLLRQLIIFVFPLLFLCLFIKRFLLVHSLLNFLLLESQRVLIPFQVPTVNVSRIQNLYQIVWQIFVLLFLYQLRHSIYDSNLDRNCSHVDVFQQFLEGMLTLSELDKMQQEVAKLFWKVKAPQSLKTRQCALKYALLELHIKLVIVVEMHHFQFDF
jgi:hypothetical protein